MFATSKPGMDFAETRNAPPHEPAWAVTGFGRLDAVDSADLLAKAEADDRQLLRLVLCAAAATLVLALASSLA